MPDPLIARHIRNGRLVATYRIVAFPFLPESALPERERLRCDICGREAVRFDDFSSYCEAHRPVEVERVG